MIIKKKNNKEKEQKEEVSIKSSKNIIKGGLKKKVNPLKQKALEKKENKAQNHAEEKPKKLAKTPLEAKLEEYEKIDITTLDFKERYERRRGERRRGFRRIDERALVSRAQEEAQSIRELAAKEGYKNGLLEAQSEIDMLKDSLKEFVALKQTVYEELSDHVLEIALAVAKKIIKKETETSSEVLKAVMSEVLDELKDNDEKITIKVNPDEVDFARASLPEILSEKGINAKINVMADELIEKGSCTITAQNGVVDANFRTQLSIIQNAFGIYNGGE